MPNVLVWTETTLNRTYRSLMTGCVWPTGQIFELLPVMFAYVNTANKISFPFSHKLSDNITHICEQLRYDACASRDDTSPSFYSENRDYKSVKFFLFTCVLPLYCSTREGMTAAVMMWLALLEALQAAWSSLALGHTSFRSGSHRWCLQSAKTSYVQGKAKIICFVKHT